MLVWPPFFAALFSVLNLKRVSSKALKAVRTPDLELQLGTSDLEDSDFGEIRIKLVQLTLPFRRLNSPWTTKLTSLRRSLSNIYLEHCFLTSLSHLQPLSYIVFSPWHHSNISLLLHSNISLLSRTSPRLNIFFDSPFSIVRWTNRQSWRFAKVNVSALFGSRPLS